jgi:spermidine synthase
MGILFTKVVEHGAKQWGQDIGYIQGFNTIGSCLGILLVGLYGYEINFLYLGIGIAFGYFLLFLYAKKTLTISSETKVSNTFSLYTSIVISIFIIMTYSHRQYHNSTLYSKSQSHFYFGREGVIEISPDRNVYMNRLWHSNLSNGNDIGTSNWIHAAIPFLTVPCNKNNLEVLVIGLGTGITASALARSNSITNIDAYEINPELKQVMQDYPVGSLNILNNPKINIYWEDARSGLALRTKKYDLILQAPLYLKQAGSSILLSKEYFNLIRQRLKTDGVFSIYSNSLGHSGQALLVRNTARNVFKYGHSFNNGYILTVSNNQITYPACSKFINSINSDSMDTFEKEILTYGIDKLTNMLDMPKLNWGKNEIIITDDRPLVEYPLLADAVMRE